jgi:hypothetical protein
MLDANTERQNYNNANGGRAQAHSSVEQLHTYARLLESLS